MLRRIAIDPQLLGAQEWLAPLGTLVPVLGRNTDPKDLKDCDALAIRSVTRVDAQLLQHGSPSFVGTTTIGFDHIDTAYLESRGIQWTNAPGCNAPAVADYVESTLANYVNRHQLDARNLTFGVVGVGNIGKQVAQRLSGLHAKVLLCDPPRKKDGSLEDGVPFARILSDCDVICIHVPLIKDGPTPTQHLFDEKVLNKLRGDQLLINAGRGGAIDNQALNRRLDQPNAPTVVLDVWENEPNIMAELWPKLWLATPHIAGHALEGKLRGTRMVARSLADSLGQKLTGPSVREVAEKMFPRQSFMPGTAWHKKALSVYDVADDDRRFRKALNGLTGAELAAAFDKLRDEYPKRREIH